MSAQASETESDETKSDSDLSATHVDEVATSSRFNPLASLNKRKWTLEGDQVSFCNKYFGEYVGESAIKKTILKKITLSKP
jgi:hypothetical protein